MSYIKFMQNGGTPYVTDNYIDFLNRNKAYNDSLSLYKSNPKDHPEIPWEKFNSYISKFSGKEKPIAQKEVPTSNPFDRTEYKFKKPVQKVEFKPKEEEPPKEPVSEKEDNKNNYFKLDQTTGQISVYNSDKPIFRGSYLDFFKNTPDSIQFYNEHRKDIESGNKVNYKQKGGLFTSYEPTKSIDVEKPKELEKEEHIIPRSQYDSSLGVTPEEYTDLFSKMTGKTVKFEDSNYKGRSDMLGLDYDISTKEGKLKKMYSDLTNKGLTREKAIAVLANMDVETGGTFDPTLKQKGGGQGYGLMQVSKNGVRYTDMVEKTRGHQDEFLPQWNYILGSIVDNNPFISRNHWGGFGRQDSFLKDQSNNLEYLTKKFGSLYLRPGTPNWDKRVESAKNFDKLLQ